MQNYVLLETNNTLQGNLRKDNVGWYTTLPDVIDTQIGIRLFANYKLVKLEYRINHDDLPTTMISIYDVHFYRIYDV